MDIFLKKYTGEERIALDEAPEWDHDSCLSNEYVLYGPKKEIWIAALAGDPPIIGWGDTRTEALSELAEKLEKYK